MNEKQREQVERVQRMVRSNFGAEIPSEEEIRGQIKVLVGIQDQLDESHVEMIFNHMCAILSIRMDLGVLIQAPGHTPWLTDRKQEWRVWKAYRQCLAEEGRSPVVIDTLNESIDIVLDQLGDPKDQNGWDRRGLVIGDVQSGKTSTYIGLIDKAIDVGYNVIILLTGNTEALRRQTQERVDFGVIGRDSSRNTKHLLNSNHLIGVGEILDSTASVDAMTTHVVDFRKTSHEAVNTIPGPEKVVVFVTKKNKRILEQIHQWFTKGLPEGAKSKLPMLLIDDEADYASINTKNPEDDPTAINAAIRNLLSLFSKNSYVGFTATPFANIFIDDEVDRDLFPRHFIYGLKSPTNYVGPGSIFGDDSDDALLQPIDDAEEVFPLKHKKHLQVDCLPDSMLDAIRTFLITNALRDLRGQSGLRSAMLINVSRLVLVQNQVTRLVQEVLSEYKNAIELHSDAYTRGVGHPALSEIEGSFEKHFAATEFEWEDVLNELASANSTVRTFAMNGGSGDNDELPARYIAVGGDILSRGLTLEGLSTSYFYRVTRAADTLMQMGRWFGYREGYADICRLWIDEEMIGAYRSVALALDELRHELLEMRRQQLTPEQYGLSVNLHPETLAITARNKMRSAKEGKKAISIRGNAFESRILSTDHAKINGNNLAMVELLRSLVGRYGAPEMSGKRPIWRNVDKFYIADFLDSFEVFASPSNTIFLEKGIAGFARTAVAPDLQAWDVAVMGGKGAPLEGLPGVDATFTRPTRTFGGDESRGWRVSGSKMRVAGPGDVGTPLDKATIDELVVEYRVDHPTGSIPDHPYIERLTRPLLLLYPFGVSDLKEPGRKVPPSDVPLVAAYLAIPGKRQKEADNIVYLNRVAQRLWFPELVDSHEEDEEDVN